MFRSPGRIWFGRAGAPLTSIVRVLVLVFVSSSALYAQGGPPMITDDPDTPGDGNWEINMASEFERERGAWALAAPYFDINYGLGDTIQLKVEGPYMTGYRDKKPAYNPFVDHGGVNSSPGDIRAGVKWRFYDTDFLKISTYPQGDMVISPRSVEHELVDRGYDVILPVEASFNFCPLKFNPEAGYVFRQHGGGQIFIGWLLAYEIPHKDIELLGEVYGEWTVHSAERSITYNVGARFEMSEMYSWMFAFGYAAAVPKSRFIVYAGLQLRLGKKKEDNVGREGSFPEEKEK